MIQVSVAKHFPQHQFPELECISEPGRYFAHASGTLFTMVQGKRKEAHRFLYYINDGVYGSFNNIMFDHAKPVPVAVDEFFATPMISTQPLASQQQLCGFSSISAASLLHPSTIFGPTCDSIDVMVENHPMRELRLGEWLVFDHMGAYTTAAASNFNGVPKPTVSYVRSLQ